METKLKKNLAVQVIKDHNISKIDVEYAVTCTLHKRKEFLISFGAFLTLSKSKISEQSISLENLG